MIAVRLQQSIVGAGRTDIEIETEFTHLILEAKRGWQVETPAKLATYATRFVKDTARQHAIAVVSQASVEWAAPRLPDHVAGVPVSFASWRTIDEHVETVAAGSRSHAEKRLLRELHRYLKGVMTMRDVGSNLVYVVSLGTGPLIDDGTSFADIVTKHSSYFHPVGGGRGGRPSEPPNYMGFRFHRQLQQIRHVDDYEVHDEPWRIIHPPMAEVGWGPSPHFWYRLGPPIVPSHTVRTGPKITRALRVWAAIDLLLTSKTITEARDKTNVRLEAAGEL